MSELKDASPDPGGDGGAVPAASPAPAAAPGSERGVLISAEGLTKYYGPFTAVRGVSFNVYRGEVVAFLGPNGAGKSTTMKMLTGVISPDAGQACISGLLVDEHRREVATKVGYLPENGPLYPGMTPLALLRFLGEARGLEPDQLERRIAAVSERLQLGSVLGKAIHKLSRGYRQRVGLAQALLHEPEVLILDEPTNGLDPNQIREVRETIRSFGRDRAVLLSTHILQEVEATCDRVVFIHEGQVVFQGSVAELKETAPGGDLDAAFAAHTSGRRRS